MQTNNHIDKIKEEIRRKKLELAKIMSTSGSDTGKTPGYTETEHEIKFFEDRLRVLTDQIKNLPQKTESGIIGVGSEIKLKSIDQRKILIIKILLEIPTPLPKSFLVATPDSIVGKSLIGKKIGDRIKLNENVFVIETMK